MLTEEQKLQIDPENKSISDTTDNIRHRIIVPRDRGCAGKTTVKELACTRIIHRMLNDGELTHIVNDGRDCVVPGQFARGHVMVIDKGGVGHGHRYRKCF